MVGGGEGGEEGMGKGGEEGTGEGGRGGGGQKRVPVQVLGGGLPTTLSLIKPYQALLSLIKPY